MACLSASISSTSRRHRRWRGRHALPVLLVLAGSLAACASGSEDGGAASEDAAEAPASDGAGGDPGPVGADADDTGGEAAPGGGSEEPGEQAPPTAELAALGRERIRTAWITLELADPEQAVDQITATAEAHGGFVALADLVRDDRTGELGGTVTMRVPSEALLPALDALEMIAEDAPVRRIEEQDVSAQLTDLRAQLTNLSAYEEELRALLTEIREATSDPDDLLPVVERLQSVRSDIDRLRAQRDGLEDRVALSTITVTLTPTPTDAPIVATSWTPLRTLEEALAVTGRALAGIADATIWLVVTLLPVLLVLAGPPAAVWWWLRRRRLTAQPAAPEPPVA